MLTIDALREYGANVDEGLGRCLNKEEFYLKLVKMAASDAGFEKLEKAVEEADLDTAFEAAHALKGVLGNLALTPVFEPASALTELLRARQPGDYAALLAQIAEQRDILRTLCAD